MIGTGNYPDSSEPVAKVNSKKRMAGGSRLFPKAYPNRGWSGSEFENQTKPMRLKGGRTKKRG